MADLNISVDMTQLKELNREMLKTTSTYNIATRELETFSGAQMRSVGSMNRMGVVTQQAGYQIGDFLVQVQSGTNAFVAFGQQATQLAGLMTTFGGKFIAIGTALGIIIPLATALGAVWMRTSQEVDPATDSLKRYEEALKSIIDRTEEARLKSIGQILGVTTEEVTVLERIKQVEAEREEIANNILNIQRNAVVAQGMYDIVAAGAAWQQERQLKALEGQLKTAEETLENLRSQNYETQYTNAMLAKQEALYVRQLQTQTRVVVLTKEQAAALEEGRKRAEQINTAISKFAGTTVKVGVEFQASFVGFTDQAMGWASGLYNNMKDLASNEGTMWSSPRPRSAPAMLGEPELGSGGGGGGGGGNARLESLISELQTESETLAAWYEESQAALQAASDAELTILGGKHEAMLRLTEEYHKRKNEIDEMGNQWSLESALGGAAEIAGALGAFNKKALKAQAVFAAGAALIDTYQGAARELRKGTFGFATAAAVIAKGLGFVAAIKSAGEGNTSISAGGGGRGTSTVPQQAAAPSPQTVYIDSLDPAGLYSGQTLINLFDAFYDENDKRGKVFVVARG
jgi:hypothetical protein